jgi:ABC-2 type transport system permease protein
MFRITIIGIAFMPLMLGLLMFIKKYPDLAHSSLMLSKATMIPGNADWQTFFGLFAQMIVGAGLLIFGFVASWIFGREYSDRTIKDLLALPLPRWSVAVGKFIVTALWCGFLFIIAAAVTVCVGFALHLDGWSLAYMRHCMLVLSAGVLLDIWLNTVAAFVANWSRGFLAPIGFTIVALVLANFASMLGFATYYPWGIPMLFAVNGLTGTYPSMISLIIVAITGLTGFVGTLLWWRFEDQT